jgi:hypothetical protein
VTNYSAQPQRIPVDYSDVPGIDPFAAKRRRDFAGQALQVGRLTGFCLLVRREVLEQIGGFDERYGLGFFDDDDLSVRARQAGFQLFVALGVFVHHFGSRTFAGLGIDCRRQLQENFERFRAKWGPERSAGYRWPGAAEAETAGGQGHRRGTVPNPAGAAGAGTAASAGLDGGEGRPFQGLTPLAIDGRPFGAMTRDAPSGLRGVRRQHPSSYFTTLSRIGTLE